MKSVLQEPLFRVCEVSFSYQNLPALSRVSLDIKSGERLALLGPNGSGKSTLLRLLGALAFPQQGTIEFSGELLTPSAFEKADFFYSFRRRVGIVFQNPDVQLFNASVFDEVAFGPLQLSWAKNEIRERVMRTLSDMGVESLAERPPFRLSGGEKKRIALASVLVTEPEVLLLDEPVASLDPASQNGIVDLLASWAGGSRTVVTATHDLDTLEMIADRCLVLANGAVVADTTPYQVLHDPHLLQHVGLLHAHRHHHVSPAQPHTHVHLDDLSG
jgi:cobalt/nickel transport system ATP-binding protein